MARFLFNFYFIFCFIFCFMASANKSLAADYNWDADIGFGSFNDLQVPYGAGTFGGKSAPRADGTIAENDSTRRVGTAFSTEVGMTQIVGADLALISSVSFMQVGSMVTAENPSITSTYDRFGLDSRVRYSPSPWTLDVLAGASLKRTDWRNVSTAHLLDEVALLAGAGFRKFHKFRFDAEAEWLLFGRFAWEEAALDLTPKTMKDVDVSSNVLKLKVSYLTFNSLKFQLSVEHQTTQVDFKDTTAAYRSSGLEVSSLTEKKKSVRLSADHFTVGFSRSF